MIRQRCEKCGQSYPSGGTHECVEKVRKRASNDNGGGSKPPGSFDEKAWKRGYMREYMKRLRERKRQERRLDERPKDMAS